MNGYYKKAMVICGFVLTAALFFHMAAPLALAEEGSGNWRANYDFVMKWINFAILVFIIYKFGKEPIMKFLRGQKDELAHEIDQLESEKQKVASRINETFKILEDSEAHFKNLKKRIVTQGEKKKNEIMENARSQSLIMMDMAKRKAENRIVEAKNEFKAELVDTAFDLVTSRLPEMITEEDNQRMVEDYLAVS